MYLYHREWLHHFGVSIEQISPLKWDSFGSGTWTVLSLLALSLLNMITRYLVAQATCTNYPDSRILHKFNFLLLCERIFSPWICPNSHWHFLRFSNFLVSPQYLSQCAVHLIMIPSQYSLIFLAQGIYHFLQINFLSYPYNAYHSLALFVSHGTRWLVHPTSADISSFQNSTIYSLIK